MKMKIRSLPTLFAALAVFASLAVAVQAAPADRCLHVKVEDGTEGGSVNVNIPLTMAEKILPAIHNGKLHEGRIAISSSETNGVDVKAILDAIHAAPDNELVSVKRKDQDVYVFKSNGNIVVKIRDRENKNAQKVDATIPLSVADALFSTFHENELNVAAALQALDRAGQRLAITVDEAAEHVHIWVDERNSQ